MRVVSKRLFAAADRLFPSPTGPRILIYHQVGTDHGHQMEVRLDHFVAQMARLAEDYDVVDLAEALSRWDEPESHRLVVLTFDDGYVDTYETAFPIIKEHGFPFTLYVATQQVERAPEESPRSSLDWSQITTMLESGLLNLGAHTHTHPDLRKIDFSVVVEEIEKSNELVRSRTGVSPVDFAYPWGYWSETAAGVVDEVYATAVLGGTPTSTRALDPHRVPRFPVQRSDGIEFFMARLDGGLLAEEWVRRRLRGYRGP